MASASDFQSEDKGSIPFTCTIYKLGVIAQLDRALLLQGRG